MSHRRVTILVLAVLLCSPLAAGRSEQGTWQAFGPLVGRWNGEGSGFGGISDVTHEWELVLQGEFLRLQTKSVVRRDGGAGEVHEDVGFLSHDADRSSFVFRQFLSEGFVNTFDVSIEEGEALVLAFGARETQSAGGMRVQMRLEFLSDTEYEMVLELATPGKDFSPCQRMRMERME